MTVTEERRSNWLARFNAEPQAAAIAKLLTVCSSRRWAEGVAARRPYRDAAHLQDTADAVWLACAEPDWRDALTGHPRIGERGGTSQAHSRREQAGVAASDSSVLQALREGNRRYEERFGHVFLISAEGRSAEEILANLTKRLENPPETELREAAEQHGRITRLRLARLLGSGEST